MWRQVNSDESLGRTSKITSVLVASMVDKYLCDNNFSNTRYTFRNEASSLFLNSSLNQDPKGFLTLEAMLDEYIFLKKQNAIFNQGRVTVTQERKRIEIFWQGMQNALNAYNAFQRPPPPNVAATNANFAEVSPPRVCDRTPPVVDALRSRNRILFQNGNFNSQKLMDDATGSRITGSRNCAPSGSQVQGTNVGKGSFNHPLFFDPNNSQILETPPRTQSSHCDTYVSPTNFLVASCNQDASPSCCTMISTNGVMVGPEKQMAYKESSHCISPIEADTAKASEKDDVRSKLNFDASNMPKSLDKSLANEVSTSESDKEVDISDIDFSNLDWPLPGISDEDFSFYDLGPTDSNDNASSSRSSHELQVSTDKYLNIQGLDSQHV